MSKALFYKQRIEINASQSEVWDALTNPQMTRKYMFDCYAVSDWKVGSSLIWRGAQTGVDYVIGSVVKFEPETKLAFTTFDPSSGYEDKPENYLTTEYSLSFLNGTTILDISQGDFGSVENGESRFKETSGHWVMTMDLLKAVLEDK